jgi:hypothetical protein
MVTMIMRFLGWGRRISWYVCNVCMKKIFWFCLPDFFWSWCRENRIIKFCQMLKKKKSKEKRKRLIFALPSCVVDELRRIHDSDLWLDQCAAEEGDSDPYPILSYLHPLTIISIQSKKKQSPISKIHNRKKVPQTHDELLKNAFLFL